MLSQRDVDTLLIGSMGEDFHRNCGFCGSEDTRPVHVITLNDWAITCNSCKAQGPIANTEREAWIRWNLREDDYNRHES